MGKLRNKSNISRSIVDRRQRRRNWGSREPLQKRMSGNVIPKRLRFSPLYAWPRPSTGQSWWLSDKQDECTLFAYVYLLSMFMLLSISNCYFSEELKKICVPMQMGWNCLLSFIHFSRAQDIKTKKHHIPIVDRTPLEPPPVVVVVVGPPKVGKSTLIRCLIKNFTRQKLGEICGPVTIVSGKFGHQPSIQYKRVHFHQDLLLRFPLH